jgi:hypothetical protein
MSVPLCSVLSACALGLMTPASALTWPEGQQAIERLTVR